MQIHTTLEVLGFRKNQWCSTTIDGVCGQIGWEPPGRARWSVGGLRPRAVMLFSNGVLWTEHSARTACQGPDA